MYKFITQVSTARETRTNPKDEMEKSDNSLKFLGLDENQVDCYSMNFNSRAIDRNPGASSIL